MREYYFEVKLSFGCALDAPNAQLAKQKLKDNFKEDFNLELSDAEITANGYEEKHTPEYDTSM